MKVLNIYEEVKHLPLNERIALYKAHGFTSDHFEALPYWEYTLLRDVSFENRGFVVREEDGRVMHYWISANEITRSASGHGGRLFVFETEDGDIINSNNVWCQGEIPNEHLAEFLQYVGLSKILPIEFKERMRQETAHFHGAATS